MTHLTRDDLERWLTAGDPRDRERVVGHLASCDECGRLYGEMLEAAPVAVAPEHVRLAAELAPAGHRAFDARRSFWLSPRFAAAAAAAVLLGVLAVPPIVRWASTDDSGVATRGTSLQVLSPVGAISVPPEFRWTSPYAAPRYRVELLDAADRAIGSATVTREQASWSELSRTPPSPGATYRWRVTALDANGAPIASSNTGSFTVTR